MDKSNGYIRLLNSIIAVGQETKHKKATVNSTKHLRNIKKMSAVPTETKGKN